MLQPAKQRSIFSTMLFHIDLALYEIQKRLTCQFEICARSYGNWQLPYHTASSNTLDADPTNDNNFLNCTGKKKVQNRLHP